VFRPGRCFAQAGVSPRPVFRLGRCFAQAGVSPRPVFGPLAAAGFASLAQAGLWVRPGHGSRRCTGGPPREVGRAPGWGGDPHLAPPAAGAAAIMIEAAVRAEENTAVRVQRRVMPCACRGEYCRARAEESSAVLPRSRRPGVSGGSTCDGAALARGAPAQGDLGAPLGAPATRIGLVTASLEPTVTAAAVRGRPGAGAAFSS
jgi:hypothetical protein